MQSKHMKEVFIAESLGHVSARDVRPDSSKKIILSKGSMIGPRQISALAARGINKVAVYDKPRISVIVIGEGLISPGTTPSPGKVYDFSSAALKAALELMRIRPVLIRCVPNKWSILRTVIPFAISHSDIIILVTKEVGQSLDWVYSFVGGIHSRLILVRQKTEVKRVDPDESKKPVFCLPCDNELIFENFEKFVQPAILAFMGFVSQG
jgi:molybdopterin molybdotransferase